VAEALLRLGPQALKGGKDPFFGPFDIEGDIVEIGDFEIEITEEMIDAAKMYHTKVYNDLLDAQGLSVDYKMGIEERVVLSDVNKDCYGTVDSYTLVGDHLRMYDFKYGKGLAVSPKHNKQLQYYALGVCDFDKIKKIDLTIVQPRSPDPSGEIATWRVEVEELYQFKQDLKGWVDLTLQGKDSPIKAGSWCHFCPALPVCPEVHKQAALVAQQEFAPPETALPEVSLLTSKDVSRILKMKPLLTKWLQGAEAFAYERMLAGEKFEGFKLVNKRARRIWADEEEAAKVLTSSGLSPWKEKEMLSPAQVEKKAKAEDIAISKDEIKKLLVTYKGGATIAPITDKRVEINNALTDFKNEPITQKDK
jgi:hypothetical protein